MGNRDSFSYIIDFLLNPHDPDNITGYQILFKIFVKEFGKYELLKKHTEPEDLFNDFLTKVLFKQNFSLNPTLKEKIKDKSTNIVSYIYQAIHNFLRTNQREILKKYYTEEKKTRDIQLIQENEEGKEFEIITINKNVSPIVIMEAKEISETIQKEFSETEKRTLCYMFLNDKNFFGENISDDAAYKRKSRLKSRLSELVREKGFSIEGFTYFVQEYLMSEICNKFS